MLSFKEARLTYATRRAYDLLIKTLVPGSRRQLPHHPRIAVIPTDYVGISIIGNGIYERREIELLTMLCRQRALQSCTYLDIGANIGNHAITFSTVFAEVVAFEPNPDVAALLRTNLLLSRTGNVRVHQVGLGRSDAELKFSIREDGNDGSGSFASGSGETILPVRNGDSYLALHEPEIAAGSKRIGLVKCDIEGFEADAFAGLRNTLTLHRPIVTFESNDRQAGDKAWAELRTAGYDTLSCLRETGDDGGRLGQELRRLVFGYACWFEPLTALPERRCNLVASFGPLV